MQMRASRAISAIDPSDRVLALQNQIPTAAQASGEGFVAHGFAGGAQQFGQAEGGGGVGAADDDDAVAEGLDVRLEGELHPNEIRPWPVEFRSAVGYAGQGGVSMIAGP